MNENLKKFFSGTYLGLMLVFLYAPILILIIFSFNQSKTLGNWTGFTFDWYAQLFRTPEITDALVVTLSVAAISSVVATVLGITVAGEVFGPTQALGVGAVLLGVLLGQPAVVDAVVRVLPGRRGRSG